MNIRLPHRCVEALETVAWSRDNGCRTPRFPEKVYTLSNAMGLPPPWRRCQGPVSRLLPALPPGRRRHELGVALGTAIGPEELGLVLWSSQQAITPVLTRL
jgi:hypothetical protein